MAKKKAVTQRVSIIDSVKTPLGFFTLAALVVEVGLGALASRLSGFPQLVALYGMVFTLVLLVCVVAFIAYRKPGTLTALQPLGKGEESPTKPHFCFLTRNELVHIVGSVEDRLQVTQQQLCVSGIDCKLVVVSESPRLEALLRRGVVVKIMCLDPACPTAQFLPALDRFPTVESFAVSLQEIEDISMHLHQEYGDSFQLRYLPFFPALNFFISDPSDPRGLVKAEIYTMKPWEPLGSRPHIVLESGQSHEWRHYVLNQWDYYWSVDRDPFKQGPKS
jgi:hypothetical protein